MGLLLAMAIFSSPPQAPLLLLAGETGVQVLVDHLLGDTHGAHGAINWNRQPEEWLLRMTLIKVL